MTTTTTSAPNTSAEIPTYPHIAIVGGAGAGKTTGAKILTEQYGYQIKHFAQGVKDVAALIWGEDARADRAKLQGLGGKVREIDPDAWCSLAGVGISEACNHGPVVVDDCRFPNEVDLLRELGFVFLRVTAPVEERLSRLQLMGKDTTLEQLSDVTETSIDDLVPFDEYHNNDGNMALWSYDNWIERVLNRWRRSV